MLHQPWGGMQGTASDIAIHADEIIKTKKKLIEIIHNDTGRPTEEIERDTDRDFFMSAEKAKEYGVIDEVLTSLRDKSTGED